ncbi:two-component system, sensor histidine kinase YcbA [Dethiosulfatibacter aminovorans DSM 17477]|uniref:histidine kinase n=1 Tax=Dethiosulfatibacter aminovorans DSM 17477 TaxID=1121476 RepID=A0A1M6JD43_9FIRM|nr:sensor histidine kinase [Dethiosulfatibacter aminovorans]SHJ44598.1 two-component system, sensor histidine kinase YcbA [Dethiosulfatibacter aminovorans DSM 17477]
MKDLKQMILIGLFVSVGSQFHLKFFSEGFLITSSIIILPILLYIYDYLSAFKTVLIVAVMSPCFRYLIEIFRGYTLSEAAVMVYPDIFFYVAYAFFFYLLYTRKKRHQLSDFILAILMCDFLSNLVELGVRTRVTEMEDSMILLIIGVAVVRAIIVFALILLLETYKSIMDKRDHLKRYEKLYMLTSFFKSESYYIKKNMDQIESLMKKGFEIHKAVAEGENNEGLEKMTLEFAKDIHEVKKDYQQVVKGLDILEDDKMESVPMDIADIVKIITASIDKSEVNLRIAINFNEKIKEHYYLTSILRNMINNSLEAFGKTKYPRIDIETERQDDACIFTIRDNGCGIKPEYIDDVFFPGFSTKFNMETGDIFRGLGLSIVKDLIETHFNGRLAIDSKVGTGTEMKIEIPIANLRGDI